MLLHSRDDVSNIFIFYMIVIKPVIYILIIIMYYDLLDTIKDEVSTYILWIACTALPTIAFIGFKSWCKTLQKIW